MNKRILLGIFSFFLLVATAYANTNFDVQSIQVNGLQGISKDTVLSYIKLKPGEILDQKASDEIIQDLYKTGFFNNVRLSRSGNQLIVTVDQRPIISTISISGNEKIETKQLKEVLNKLKFSEGQVFNPSILEKIKGSLSEEYMTLGRYNSQITTTVTKEKRNRVAVAIHISEGVISKIQQIKVIGNRDFDESTLLSQFKLTTPGLWTWYTDNDEYTQEKLNADLESLRSYYLDRGYLKFKANSSQVSVSPDRKSVYILVNVHEGQQYQVSGYSLTGRLILPKEKIVALITVKNGDVFSRKAITAIDKTIIDALGAKGYANAQVNVDPKIDDKTKTVYLTFNVIPGSRVYIRHITFSDNYKTNNEVLRRQVSLTEGGVFKTNKVQDSKRSLLQLPYLKDVDVTTTPVPGKPDQVDLNYKVTETPSAQMQAGVGYSTLEKLMFNAGITQKNVFGTGNALGLNFTTSAITTNVSLDYFQPYYTKSGISRDISVYATRYDSSKAHITDYAVNDYGVAMNYGIPLNEFNSFNVGGGYENNYLNVGGAPSTQQSKFTKAHGRHFYQFTFNMGWTYSGFDRYLFPTRGATHSINAMTTIPYNNHSLEYYKFNYNAVYFHPLVASFIGKLNGNVDYGNGFGRYTGSLPFFKNFYAGGFDSVRGFESNTLGPKDSNGDSFGGNFELNGSAGLVLPKFISDTVRNTIFIDAGNAYQTYASAWHYGVNRKYAGIKLNRLRYSTGIELDWRSPLGTLNFSLATPIHEYSGDDAEVFQFNIGSSF